MKKINSVFIALLFCITTNAQSDLPLPIESPKMDSYLQDRKPATLSIQINNAPDSINKVDVKCTFVTFGANFQIAKYYATNSEGFVKITLDQNLPYQQIWLSVGEYLYAGVYVNTGLKVTIDVSKIKSKDGVYLIGDGISYSGIDGELNTVMNKHTLFNQDKESKLTNSLNELCQSRKNYTSDLFLKKTDSIWQAYLNSIMNLFNNIQNIVGQSTMKPLPSFTVCYVHLIGEIQCLRIYS